MHIEQLNPFRAPAVELTQRSDEASSGDRSISVLELFASLILMIVGGSAFVVGMLGTFNSLIIAIEWLSGGDLEDLDTRSTIFIYLAAWSIIPGYLWLAAAHALLNLRKSSAAIHVAIGTIALSIGVMVPLLQYL